MPFGDAAASPRVRKRTLAVAEEIFEHREPLRHQQLLAAWSNTSTPGPRHPVESWPTDGVVANGFGFGFWLFARCHDDPRIDPATPAALADGRSISQMALALALAILRPPPSIH